MIGPVEPSPLRCGRGLFQASPGMVLLGTLTTRTHDGDGQHKVSKAWAELRGMNRQLIMNTIAPKYRLQPLRMEAMPLRKGQVMRY